MFFDIDIFISFNVMFYFFFTALRCDRAADVMTYGLFLFCPVARLHVGYLMRS